MRLGIGKKEKKKRKGSNILSIGVMISILVLFSGLVLSGIDVVGNRNGNVTEQGYGFYYYLLTPDTNIPGQVLFKYIVGITSSITLSSIIFLMFLIKYETDKTIRKTSIVILNMLKQGIIKTGIETKATTTLTTAPSKEVIGETPKMLRPVSRKEVVEKTRPISRPEKPARPPIRSPLKRCPYCGGVLPLGDVHVFCPHCGKRLK